ncbi:hypothetical protein COB11_00080 [Candidatus Aerophobetes bacterium]|uniref:MOMP-like family protein n=1 Tax=Aerophobetes bacterium TaxID=2030807 RepID=A0A2A4YNB8_UNCAE|nr:MAG: hypothetical protein COB11_00080 [Candidatus Aerophobetes bacterium]
MRKTSLLQSIVALATISAFAVEQNMDSQDTQMSSYEIAQTKMITPVASPLIKNAVDFYLSADFIYWTAIQSNQIFATDSFEPSSGTIVNDQTWNQGNVYQLDGSYSPGFKVGAGLVFDYDGWDLQFQYTWYRTTTSERVTGDYDRQNGIGLANPYTFVPVFPSGNVLESSRVVRARGRVSYNEFDLNLGRDFFISKKLTLRPHFGIRAGWINQRLIASWDITNTLPIGSDWIQMQYEMTQRRNFWNAGFRAGMDTSWMFTKNWSIFGDFALSTLWARITSTRLDVATTTGSGNPFFNVSNFQTVNRQQKELQLIPVVEISMGFRFDWYFSDDYYRFRLQAGWEQEVWIESTQNSLLARGTNLSLQGFTLKARFDF